jgi:TatD DNase family protein
VVKFEIMIDTHCHIYLNAFESDRKQMIERAVLSGLQKCYMPAIDAETHDALFEMEHQYPNFCLAMMGLHPCYVTANPDAELLKAELWLGKRKFAGIGECGLDYHWDKTFIEQQKEVLRIQMDWAKKYNLPIILHTREATQETIDLIAKYKHPELNGIFHCFGGTLEEAEQIIALGFKLGIGGVVTYKKSGLDQVLEHVELQYLVLETDAPYLAPVPQRGKRNEPSFLVHVVSKLSEIYALPVQQIIDQTSQSASSIFTNNNG